MTTLRTPIVLFLFASSMFLHLVDPLRAKAPDFEKEVAPLLLTRCVECHRGKRPSGGLSLTTRKGLLAGGDSGAVFEPKDVEDSYLLERLEKGEMPPKKQGRSQKLPASEIALIRRWLESGARWPAERELDFFERTNAVRAGRDWWSLQSVVRPKIPRLERLDKTANPIDSFIRARLETKGIAPAPKADRRTLIRRAYYDLIGLPPTEREVSEFVNDASPDAWPRLIDRLLASPRYGERWARHWLDLARYADTSGYERDQEKPFAWKYRDWVVEAFNSDMPFDRFVIHQLAGDEVPDRDERSVIATGFLRLGTWNDEPNDKADYQYERLEDLVHTTSSAFLGLTVKCARCHSHKFDPITQEDYYRMASAFWPGPVAPNRSNSMLGGPSKDELGLDKVLGWTDVRREPPSLRLLKNGERTKPLEVVVPASLSSIPTLERRFDSPAKGAKTTQRRLQLARWIADPKHPLTWRVIVNRLWQHHFGKALVRTPNNFGFLADPPTHPLLLDWLASEFLAGGRRLKSMHRLILTSETWQQSSIHPDSRRLERIDSGYRLWWRAERRRLDAEMLRDSLLSSSGELDPTVGGPGFKPTISPEALEGLSRKAKAWQASPVEAQNRRSLYVYLKRGLLPPMLTTFDLSDPTQSCGMRDVTTVPTQALALLNNRFVHDRSEHLASSIVARETNLEKRVTLAWTSVLRRPPTPGELASSLRHVATQRRTFSEQAKEPTRDSTPRSEKELKAALALHIRADRAVLSEGKEASVISIPDLSGKGRHASQPEPSARPTLVRKGFGGRLTLIFDGKGRFLHLAGKVLDSAKCTIICVVNDDNGSGHREVISNWNGSAGNSTRSLFLGLTGKGTVRFSDAFNPAGKVTEKEKPFVFSAVNHDSNASVYQNGRLLKSGPTLPNRRLDTAWVIGQQGNINGEFWKGGIAEVRVYDRPLSDDERRFVEQRLAKRYGVEFTPTESDKRLSVDVLALASLCHVLMNSNEFLYID